MIHGVRARLPADLLIGQERVQPRTLDAYFEEMTKVWDKVRKEFEHDSVVAAEKMRLSRDKDMNRFIAKLKVGTSVYWTRPYSNKESEQGWKKVKGRWSMKPGRIIEVRGRNSFLVDIGDKVRVFRAADLAVDSTQGNPEFRTNPLRAKDPNCITNMEVVRAVPESAGDEAIGREPEMMSLAAQVMRSPGLNGTNGTSSVALTRAAKAGQMEEEVRVSHSSSEEQSQKAPQTSEEDRDVIFIKSVQRPRDGDNVEGSRAKRLKSQHVTPVIEVKTVGAQPEVAVGPERGSLKRTKPPPIVFKVTNEEEERSKAHFEEKEREIKVNPQKQVNFAIPERETRTFTADEGEHQRGKLMMFPDGMDKNLAWWMGSTSGMVRAGDVQPKVGDWAVVQLGMSEGSEAILRFGRIVGRDYEEKPELKLHFLRKAPNTEEYAFVYFYELRNGKSDAYKECLDHPTGRKGRVRPRNWQPWTVPVHKERCDDFWWLVAYDDNFSKLLLPWRQDGPDSKKKEAIQLKAEAHSEGLPGATPRLRRKVVVIERGGLTTTIGADAWVNAANTELKEGGGVCGAIFAEARKNGGADELTRECSAQAPVAVGQCVATRGCRAPVKYIIHAVGPKWQDHQKEEGIRLLSDVYENAMATAARLKVNHLALAGIGNGLYGWPERLVARVAIAEVISALTTTHTTVTKVTFRCFTDSWRAALAGELKADVAVIDW